MSGMKKILIIEDEAKVQEAYQKKLTQEGFEVLQALNGKQALSLMKADGIDLIILDIILPGGINGFDVFDQLKRDPRFKDIPVVVLTNLDTEEKIALSMGAKDYFVKAKVSIDEVVEKVKEHLR